MSTRVGLETLDHEALLKRAIALQDHADLMESKLNKRLEQLEYIQEIVDNTLEECGKYPNPEGPIKCGWKNTVLAVKEAL